MKATTEALELVDNFDFNSTDVITPDDSTNKFPAEVSGSGNTVTEAFSEEESSRFYNVTGLLSQEALNKGRNLEILVPSDAPKINKPKHKSVVLQDWEGVVETVGDESFTARLRDLTINERDPSEIAEFPVEDVSDDDRELLDVGAVFYVTVGRLIRSNGRQERFGRIVFRRLPGWTSSTLRRAEKRAERFSHYLGLKD